MSSARNRTGGNSRSAIPRGLLNQQLSTEEGEEYKLVRADDGGEQDPEQKYDVDFAFMDEGVYDGSFDMLRLLADLPAAADNELEYGISVQGEDIGDLADEVAEIRVLGGKYDAKRENGDDVRFYSKTEDGSIQQLANNEVARAEVRGEYSLGAESNVYMDIIEQAADIETGDLEADISDDEVVFSGSDLGTLPYGGSGQQFAYNIQLLGDDGDVKAESGWYDGFDEIEAYDDVDAAERLSEALSNDKPGLRGATREVASKYWGWAKRAGNYLRSDE